HEPHVVGQSRDHATVEHHHRTGATENQATRLAHEKPAQHQRQPDREERTEHLGPQKLTSDLRQGLLEHATQVTPLAYCLTDTLNQSVGPLLGLVVELLDITSEPFDLGLDLVDRITWIPLGAHEPF